ncbi:MAG: lysozyme inhibitor LprI family protein [Sphingomonadales bacterium]|nr:lysozyme inhibitor LprI family protein [Sphingomonadales bacterium]
MALLMLLQWETNAQICADSGNLPQQGMNACAAWDFEQADAELNETWAEVLAYVRETFSESPPWDDRGSGEYRLRAAQRAWITLRDEHCTVMAFHMRGGSAEPMLYNGCRAEMTRQRTEELRDLMLEDR